MFSVIDENIKMLKGAYRKLKSYYYYNKSFLLMRKKIAEFEADPSEMEKTFKKMARVLANPEAETSRSFVEELIVGIDFYVLPKKFTSENDNGIKPVSNLIEKDKKLISVNFFIDAGIEIYIFDTLWTVLAAKIDRDNHLLSYNVYGNTINMSALYSPEGEINYESRTLFNRYFDRYSAWRNNAFNALEKNYDFHKDSVLISLDIKSYFYSVAFDFERLSDYLGEHTIISSLKPLTDIIKQAYSRYYMVISKYRKDLCIHTETVTPLPIGLFSSMFLGNIYLKGFDEQIKQLSGLSYYGRYVDDILIVVNRSIAKDATNLDVLEEILVNNGIIAKNNDIYQLVKYPSLRVQSDKIKIIYIDHTESRAIIDIYNNNIRVIPSQMDPIPNATLDLQSFDETAYNIDKLNQEHKIRDIGVSSIDPFRVGRFFAALPYRFFAVNVFSNDGVNPRLEIDKHISQVTKFFTGSQSAEYHSHWLNYMYFLVLTQSNKQLRDFITDTKEAIKNLNTNLDKTMFRYTSSIRKKVKQTLSLYLEISLDLALCIDFDMAQKHFTKRKTYVLSFIHSNMFQHNFVAFPLANYLEYDRQISFCKMWLHNIGTYPRSQGLENSFKFIWSPRFIHLYELQFLLFYDHHKKNSRGQKFIYTQEALIEKYEKINHILNKPFSLKSDPILLYNSNYNLERIELPSNNSVIPQKVNIAVGSVDITTEHCINGLDRWRNITIDSKKQLYDMLLQAHNYFRKKDRKKNQEPILLVFPELYLPVYWIKDLIRFAQDDQIGIVTGLQYLEDGNHQVHNYLATILPFRSGSKGYKSVFLHIREKNDYSPIEFKGLAEHRLTCKNRETAYYQVFHWKGIRLAPIVCYELTDIVARANLKGKCDIIAVSEFNPDTTYFSNIIDSTVRDLHVFIVQANTSHLGDSRVTGPYDRDSKDIYKIKGGDNDHIVIGTIEFRKLKEFQASFDTELKEKCEQLMKGVKGKIRKDKRKPEIKPLSARFKNT